MAVAPAVRTAVAPDPKFGEIACQLKRLGMQLCEGGGHVLIDQCGVLAMAFGQYGHAFRKKHWLPRVDFVERESLCCYSGLQGLLL